MNNFEKIEELYQEKHFFFQLLEHDIQKDFQIPQTISKDAIKRFLIDAVDISNSQNEYRGHGKGVTKFILWIGYLFFIAIFGKTNKKIDCDILFEEWNGIGMHYNRFYYSLHQKLLAYKSMILLTNIDKELYDAPMPVIYRESKIKCDPKIAKKIIYTSFPKILKYFFISKKQKFNFLLLYLKLIRSIAIFETHSQGVTSEILISANDNGYSALRFFLYKKNGIKNILLLQNGIRGDMTAIAGDLYIYADYYIAYGSHQLYMLKGLRAKETFAWGSLALSNNIDMMPKLEICYDILFIEQWASSSVPGTFDLDVYLTCVSNLIKFAQLHSDYKIVYRVRPNLGGNDTLLQKTYNQLVNAGIVLENTQSKNSYEAIIKSKMVVTYNSTLGFEALGLKKAVLFCNYDHLNFLPSQINFFGVITDSSYNTFEEKIFAILQNIQNNLPATQNNQYMAITPNIVKNIVSLVTSNIQTKVSI